MSRFPVSVPTRPTLLIKLKDWKDQKSWQEFYDTYWRMIYGLATRAGLPDAEAQDILQDTVLKVAQKMPGFNYDPAIGSFKVWLLTIARRRVVDSLRRIRRENAHLAQPPIQSSEQPTKTSPLDQIPDPESFDFDAAWDLEWKEGLYEAALDQVRKRVAAKQFQLFDCYVRKEWPAEKVAKVLGVTLNQVYIARNRVSEMLEEETLRLEAKETKKPRSRKPAKKKRAAKPRQTKRSGPPSPRSAPSSGPG